MDFFNVVNQPSAPAPTLSSESQPPASSSAAKHQPPTLSSAEQSDHPTPVDEEELPEGEDLDDIAWINVTEMDDLAKCMNTCVERWRNAGPEARKKMFALFAVAGIFLTVCRHGHVLVMCDMIRSGEL